jgi:hypothetical protein
MSNEVALTAPSAFDIVETTTFVRTWFNASEQPGYFCSLPNAQNCDDDRVQHVSTRVLEVVEELGDKWNRPGRGLFFCASTIKPGCTRNKENVAEVPGLWADIDFKDVLDTPDSILKRLKTLPLPPSLIVNSGHGLHVYWRFKEAIKIINIDGAQTIERIESALKLLADLVGGDMKVTQVAALMRLPGSHNSKRDGWKPVDIAFGGGGEFELDDIESMLSEVSPVVLRKLRPSATPGQINPYLAAAAELGYKTPLDVERRLSGMTYMGGDDAAIHGTQVSVTASMLNADKTVDEVVSLVLKSTRAAAGSYGERWNWKREEKAIRGMCATWLEKHPQQSGQFAEQAKQQHGISLEHYESFGTSVSKNWIIKNVVATGETSSWIGPPGAGKSALITDLAIHIAAGLDWRGHRSKARCGVVYFALERGELVKRRLIAHAAQTVGFPTKLPFSIARQVIDLLKPTCVGEIVATINAATFHHGCKIGVIVIDTYAKGIAAGGGDENSAKDQNMTLANLRRVQEETGVHVAIVGHTGKDEGKGARGSNAFVGDMDMMVQFSGEKDARVAQIIVNKDGAEGLLTRYKLEVAVLGKDADGDEITTAIISADKLDSDKQISRAKLNKSQRKAMEMLERAIVDDGRDIPISSEYPRGTGKMVTLEAWKACCVKGGLSLASNKDSTDKAFRRAVSDLDAMHRIGTWDGNVWIAYE